MTKSHAIASLLGGAIGDALGMSVEIFPRSSSLIDIHKQVLNERPHIHVTDYVEGGPWKDQGLILKAGEWTDDTAMMLCLADSLLIKKTIDVADLMRRFVIWWFKGYNSCNGKSVGLGGNIKNAIYAFDNKDPYRILGGTNPAKDAGNGSLMRLAPVPIYWHDDLAKAQLAARVQTSTTHNVQECLDGSALMCYIIWQGLAGKDKATIFQKIKNLNFESKEINALTKEDATWRTKKAEEIMSLPGRCLWSLEAAIWCVYTTDTFEEALVKAVSLSGDADTIASITGQIAGAIYGYDAIPKRWIHGLKHADKIIARAEALYERTPFEKDVMTLKYH